MADHPPPPPHILVFPFPAQGHALALLDLIHHLSLHRRFSLTVVTTPKNLPSLAPLLSLHQPPFLNPLVFPFPPHPLLPAGVENVQQIGNAGNLPIITALHKLSDPIANWFHSQPDPPVAIISDFFLGWTLALARRLHIPRFAFFSTRAFLASLTDHLFADVEAVRDLDPVVFDQLPGSPTFKSEHLPSTFRRYVPGNSDWELVREALLSNLLSDGCVFNTFHALEGPYLDFLRRKMGPQKVYAVGPVSLLGTGGDPKNLGDHPGSDVIHWLDHCPDNGSVLYVCFGSQKLMTNHQMEALAAALEQSMVRFVWVVKKPGPEMEFGLPDGFQDRVSGRGLVLDGWAPQVTILNHRAVGGFLSHCGWNSLLEAVAAGVPILGWPMEADQFVNARLLVEDLGVAVKVCEGADTVPDPVELGRRIAQSMSQGSAERKRAGEMKDEALAAVEQGGSSQIDLERFVQDLQKLQIEEKGEGIK
ncbi:unnamed protein product [Linum trigynum]|uniref:Glycosyltransferase n=1 Tax=Linum trigynum TaxID=586398 RepID=A0AAV2FAJ6_9ROSI